MSKIPVLNGNPRRQSFCHALADRYEASAVAAGHGVVRLNISALPVALDPPDYADKDRPPEQWVAHVQSAVEACDHWVIVTPLWWGGPPAALKALFDRVLMPGFAFKYRGGGLMWDKLLQNRSAHVVLTMDTPKWYFDCILSRPMTRQFKAQILGFCGFSPVRVTTLGPVKTSTAQKREAWLGKVARLGTAGR